jgi:hypothetical protein
MRKWAHLAHNTQVVFLLSQSAE